MRYIIEGVTLNSGFKWLSDHRDILKVGWGKKILILPQNPYKILNNQGERLIIFPLSWDDQYMFKYKSANALPKTLEEGK